MQSAVQTTQTPRNHLPTTTKARQPTLFTATQLGIPRETPPRTSTQLPPYRHAHCWRPSEGIAGRFDRGLPILRRLLGRLAQGVEPCLGDATRRQLALDVEFAL